MKIFQSHYNQGQWSPELPQSSDAQWVITFGCRIKARDAAFQQQILSSFSQAEIVGCTTSGEIYDNQVFDNTIVLTAVTFEETTIEVGSALVNDFPDSYAAGKGLAAAIPSQGLKYVFVLSDGQKINGTDLVKGLSESLPTNVLISGGLAGDDARFEETLVWHNEQVKSGLLVICGFYGDKIRFGHGTLGGWDTFGPERKITRSEGNVLYELDEQPALELYKSYLGDFSKDLPSSALLFPLSLQAPDQSESVVRTILNIDEQEQSMTFAGDIPQNYTAKLMKANFERLIDGASGAAENAMSSLNSRADLAILISCVGRRLVLKQRVDEELESVEEALSDNCVKCGFYSYGELSPLINSKGCHLHNQTMTITTLSED